MHYKRFFIYIAIMLFASGCRISEEHRFFKEGQVYQTSIESFVVFEYAEFIWQDPRDYQKIGYLYPFDPWPDFLAYQQQIKEKGAMEFKGAGYILGGWAVYIPIGTKLKITCVYSYIPRIDKTISVEAVFLDGPVLGRKMIIHSAEWCDRLHLRQCGAENRHELEQRDKLFRSGELHLRCHGTHRHGRQQCRYDDLYLCPRNKHDRFRRMAECVNQYGQR